MFNLNRRRDCQHNKFNSDSDDGKKNQISFYASCAQGVTFHCNSKPGVYQQFIFDKFLSESVTSVRFQKLNTHL